MRLTLFTTLAFTSLLLLFSCTSTEQKEAQIEVKAIGQGPFFSGPNSLMGPHTVDMNSLFADQNYELNAIEEARLKSIRLTLSDYDLEQFTSVSVSIVSENQPMTSIAIKNPIEKSGSEIDLTVSEEVDLAPFFETGKFTFIVDWDMKEDSYEEEMTTTVLATINTELKTK